MVSDGQGGVFVSGSPEENYKIERMVHIDAQGNLDGEWVDVYKRQARTRRGDRRKNP